MKTLIKIFALMLIITSCSKKESETINKSWYQYSLLARDSLGYVDTVYMDGITAKHIAMIHLQKGDRLDTQSSSIGLVYSSHEYLCKDISTTYFGIWTENSKEILPLRTMFFEQTLHGVTIDPLMEMVVNEIQDLRPR